MSVCSSFYNFCIRSDMIEGLCKHKPKRTTQISALCTSCQHFSAPWSPMETLSLFCLTQSDWSPVFTARCRRWASWLIRCGPATRPSRYRGYKFPVLIRNLRSERIVKTLYQYVCASSIIFSGTESILTDVCMGCQYRQLETGKGTLALISQLRTLLYVRHKRSTPHLQFRCQVMTVDFYSEGYAVRTPHRLPTILSPVDI
jgi:hypothetical protein